MTPVMFNRVVADIALSGTASKLKLTLSGGLLLTVENWNWLNEGKSGLDAVIKVWTVYEVVYVPVEKIVMLSYEERPTANLRRSKKTK